MTEKNKLRNTYHITVFLYVDSVCVCVFVK